MNKNIYVEAVEIQMHNLKDYYKLGKGILDAIGDLF